jgi:hypothetical protein
MNKVKAGLRAARHAPGKGKAASAFSFGGGAASGSSSLETIVIEVSPNGPPDGNGERQCTLTQRSAGPHGRLNGQDVELDPTYGPFLIKFELDNSLDWDSNNPFWIRRGSCPGSKYVDHKQIWSGGAKGKVVTIMDMNVDAPCTLRYRMNFDDGTYCDPIIENGGGNNQ